MECTEYRRLISRMLDGECDRSQEESIQAHLQICEGCRRAFEAMQETFSLHRGLGEPAPPDTLMAGVMAGIEVNERRSRFAGFLRVAVPVAAAVVLILGIYAGSFLAGLYTQPAANGQMAALELEYLDEYPPGSVGDAIMTTEEGGDDEH